MQDFSGIVVLPPVPVTGISLSRINCTVVYV